MGARLVRDLNPAGSASPESIISIDGLLYFTADLGEAGGEATPSPPTDDAVDDETSDDLSNEGSKNEGNNVDDSPADQLGSGLALLKSDGTTEGTTVLKEFQSINDLVDVNGELYFIADDGTGAEATGGNRLWRSDGTSRGTVLVKDLFPGADPSFPQDLHVVDGVLFYSAIDSIDKYPFVNGYEVWRREGNSVGSRFFRNLIPDKIITDTSLDEGEEVPVLDEDGNPVLIETGEFEEVVVRNPDGSPVLVETGEFEEVVVRNPDGSPVLVETGEFEEVVARNPDGSPIVIDGVEQTEFVPITEELTEFVPVTEELTEFIPVTEPLTELLFTASVTTNMFEKDSFPSDFTNINGNIFFTADSSAFYSLETRTEDTLIGGRELWFSDGTESGTIPININQNIYSFYEPLDGDYTPAESATQPEFGFVEDSASSFPRELTAFGDQLVLVANDGINGFELWTISDDGKNPRQISNLSGGNTSSSPEELTVAGDRLYFTADDGNGRQLWSITRNLDTPQRVRGAGSEPRHLTSIDGELYFSATSALGRELWRADGNEAQLVEDINPGSGSSSPTQFTALEQFRKGKTTTQLFFSADGGQRGTELWSLDLSSANASPQRYADIVDGPTSSDPRHLVNAEQRLFFTADDGQQGRELWTLSVSIQGPDGLTDGGSTRILAEENNKKVFQFSSNQDVNWSLNGGDDAQHFRIRKNGLLRFKQAPDFEAPIDLDKNNIYDVRVRATDKNVGSSTDVEVGVRVVDVNETDSSTEAILVKNIRSGAASSNPTSLTELNSNLMFAADNGKKGAELWKSGGKKSSTSLLKDINKGAADSNPSDLSPYQSDVYFSANDGLYGEELWISDGSQKGTTLLADINPGAANASPSDLTWIQKKLYFAADDGQHGRELWSYSPKTNDTRMVVDLQTTASNGSNPGDITDLNGQIVFAANDAIYGRELWISDGSASGTRLLADINPGGFSSNPSDLTPWNGNIVLTAENYLYGNQLLKLTSNALDLIDITGSSDNNIANQPEQLHASGELLFYSAETTSTPSDDTVSNPEGTDPGGFMTARNGIEAEAIEYINNYNDNIDSYREFNNNDFLDNAKDWAEFLLDSSLVTTNDASLARDWNQYFQPLSNSSPLQIPQGTPSTAATRSTVNTPGGGNEDSETLGRELWISNGEVGGSSLLMDINPGSAGSDPASFSTIGGRTYFSANNGVNGSELWVSDGTAAGTNLLVDINLGTAGSSPRWITEMDGDIYFSARSESVGRELWRLDQDEAGATRVVRSDQESRTIRAVESHADEFRFEQINAFGRKHADRIIGFNPTEDDQLLLLDEMFSGLPPSDWVTVTSSRQRKAEKNEDSALIYFEPKGKLYYDQNGSDPGFGSEGGLFVVLKGGPELLESSIVIG